MKTTKLFISCIILLLLSGCSGLKAKDTPETFDIHTGTTGLKLSFLDNMPPKEVLQGSSFKIGVHTENLGATDIKGGIIKVVNIYDEYIEVTEDSQELDVEGRSIYNPAGEQKDFEFDAANKRLKSKETNKFLFKVKACYIYKTDASAEICINPTGDKGVCAVKDVTLKSGQGAPVALIKVGEEIIKTGLDEYEAQFMLTIKNIEGGIITPVGNYKDECEGTSISNELTNRIVPSVHLSGYEVECEELEIKDDAATMSILCYTTINPKKGIYTTPLTVSFEYGYVTPPIIKAVTVKKSKRQTAYTCGLDYCKDSEQWGVCNPVYGEEDESKYCQDATKTCCTESKTLCDRQYSGKTCAAENECLSGTVVRGKCPAELVCCEKGYANCENCMDTEYECYHGYGGVDATKKCAAGKVCCVSSQTCHNNFPTHSCFPKGTTPCSEQQMSYCPGTDICCNTGSVSTCKGSCVATEGSNCVPFGGDAIGTCGTGKMCCAQAEPLCNTEHASEYGDAVGSWYCVLESEIGDSSKYTCDETQNYKCAGTGTKSRKCCKIKTKS